MQVYSAALLPQDSLCTADQLLMVRGYISVGVEVQTEHINEHRRLSHEMRLTGE